ncbi:MAG: hypothetical protein ACKVP7_25475 [Hyphomicrobiaceae bacterium]
MRRVAAAYDGNDNCQCDSQCGHGRTTSLVMPQNAEADVMLAKQTGAPKRAVRTSRRMYMSIPPRAIPVGMSDLSHDFGEIATSR